MAAISPAPGPDPDTMLETASQRRRKRQLHIHIPITPDVTPEATPLPRIDESAASIRSGAIGSIPREPSRDAAPAQGSWVTPKPHSSGDAKSSGGGTGAARSSGRTTTTSALDADEALRSQPVLALRRVLSIHGLGATFISHKHEADFREQEWGDMRVHRTSLAMLLVTVGVADALIARTAVFEAHTTSPTPPLLAAGGMLALCAGSAALLSCLVDTAWVHRWWDWLAVVGVALLAVPLSATYPLYYCRHTSNDALLSSPMCASVSTGHVSWVACFTVFLCALVVPGPLHVRWQHSLGLSLVVVFASTASVAQDVAAVDAVLFLVASLLGVGVACMHAHKQQRAARNSYAAIRFADGARKAQVAFQNERAAAKIQIAAASSQRRAFEDVMRYVCHELRNPLHGILGLLCTSLEPSTEGTPTATAKDDLLSCQKSAKQMAVILDDVLDLGQLQLGAVELSIGTIGVKQLIDECVGSMERRATVPIAVYISTEMPQTLDLDALRCRRIFTNGISNAVKQTKHGQVDVRSYMQRDCLVFEVYDTGCGLSESDTKTLFEPYAYARHRTSRPTSLRFDKGTGLNLAIASRLVHLMNGTISLENRTDGINGAVFRVKIPVVASTTTSSHLPAMAPLPSPGIMRPTPAHVRAFNFMPGATNSNRSSVVSVTSASPTASSTVTKFYLRVIRPRVGRLESLSPHGTKPHVQFSKGSQRNLLEAARKVDEAHAAAGAAALSIFEPPSDLVPPEDLPASPGTRVGGTGIGAGAGAGRRVRVPSAPKGGSGRKFWGSLRAPRAASPLSASASPRDRLSAMRSPRDRSRGRAGVSASAGAGGGAGAGSSSSGSTSRLAVHLATSLGANGNASMRLSPRASPRSIASPRRSMSPRVGGSWRSMGRQRPGGRPGGRLPLKSPLRVLVSQGPDAESDDVPARKARHVLICDDEAINRKLLQRQVKKCGYTSLICSDGDELLAMVEAGDVKDGQLVDSSRTDNPVIDLVFLDIMMERTSGDEVCRTLRDVGITTPIVAATANGLPDDLRKYMGAGFSSVLLKPFTVREVHKTLSALVDLTVHDESLSL